MENDIKQTNSSSTQANQNPKNNKKAKKIKKPKAAKIVNIVTAIVILLALVFTLEAVYAKKHLHNNYFGYAMLPVKTNSMKVEDGGSDNFKRGDLIFVKLISDEKKRNLEPDQVITFKFVDMQDGTEKLNTHRIIGKVSGGYITQGDAEVEIGDKPTERVNYDDVVGVFKNKTLGVGHFFLFMESKPGMFVVIVIPFIFLLLLSIFYFVKSFKLYSKEKSAEVAQSTIEQEKERLRQEILAELEKQNANAPTNPPPLPQDNIAYNQNNFTAQDSHASVDAGISNATIAKNIQAQDNKEQQATQTVKPQGAAKTTAAKTGAAKTGAAKTTAAKKSTGSTNSTKSSGASKSAKSTTSDKTPAKTKEDIAKNSEQANKNGNASE